MTAPRGHGSERAVSAWVAVFSLAACATPRPTVTPDRASIERIDTHGIELAVALDVTNETAVEMSIRAVTAHVVLDGRFDVGTFAQSKSIRLAAGKPTTLTVPVSVKWKDVGPLMELAASDRPVPYAVDGVVSVDGAAVHFDVPYHLKGSVTHAEIVRATKRSIPGLSSD